MAEEPLPMDALGVRSNVNVGGGEGYDDIFTEEDADHVVWSPDELLDAAASAAPGEVVFVPGSAALNIGGSQLEVADGVTLASDRGRDGSSGGVIRSTDDASGGPYYMIEPGAGARITGLHVIGAHGEYEPNGRYLHLIRGTEGEFEVDNCEIEQGGYAAVNFADGATSGSVHHCDIHDTWQNGNGYGVDVGSDRTEVYANHFNLCRHAVAGGGRSEYEVRDNVFGADFVDAVVDIHCPGGSDLHVHHNECHARRYLPDTRFAEEPAVFWVIRGIPTEQAVCEWNWAANDIEPPMARPDSWPNGVVTQTTAGSTCEARGIRLDGDDFENVTIRSNRWGGDPPSGETPEPRRGGTSGTVAAVGLTAAVLGAVLREADTNLPSIGP